MELFRLGRISENKRVAMMICISPPPREGGTLHICGEVLPPQKCTMCTSLHPPEDPEELQGSLGESISATALCAQGVTKGYVVLWVVVLVSLKLVN